MPKIKRRGDSPLTKPLIDGNDEGVTNPLQQDDRKGYEPPSPAGVQLDSLDLGYVLTKEQAQSITIIEPNSSVPMTLFDYFKHKISQEAIQALNDKNYGKDMQSHLHTLIDRLDKAPATDDIKQIVRHSLNQFELNSEVRSKEVCLEIVRANLNEHLEFQPPVSLSSAAIDKKTSGKTSYGTMNDKWNASGRDLIEHAHATVEAQITTLNMKRAIQDLRGPSDDHQAEHQEVSSNRLS